MMDNSRPIPKPRKSIGQPDLGQGNESTTHIISNNWDSEACSRGDQFELAEAAGGNNEELPPPYSSVSDTNPQALPPQQMNNYPSKVCSNDNDPNSWMFVARDEPTVKPGNSPEIADFCVVNPAADTPMNNPHIPFQSGATSNVPSNAIPPGPGWNVNLFNDNMQPPEKPPRAQVHAPPENINQNFNPGQHFCNNMNIPPMPMQYSIGQPLPPYPQAPPIYPTMPPVSGADSSTACTENLFLRFGKQGSSVRDFVKPIGLAVSKQGHYVVSDNGGEQNKIFIFNSGGELNAAFKTGYKVEDLTMTLDDEIFAAVQSNTCSFRHFTIGGQLKGDLGKFFAYETTCGIAVLNTGGAVLTGPTSHCVYILTDQMKLATKFGRKGNGDGYFLSPSHVAVDSRNHIIVTDNVNNCVQVFNSQGKFKYRFDLTTGGSLNCPLGVCVDNKDNIIVSDSGNGRVEVFSPRGAWLSTVVKGTFELGENVKPVNVAWTPTGKVAVLLRGPYFAEVRVYSSFHQQIYQESGPVSGGAASVWYTGSAMASDYVLNKLK